MFRYLEIEGSKDTHGFAQETAEWTGTGPLTPAIIEAEALDLMQARAKARAAGVYNYERDDLGKMIDALARLGLQTDYGADAESGDISGIAECVADYQRYWGEQLERTDMSDWAIGLDGSGLVSITVYNIHLTYRVRYRPHYLAGTHDHFEFQLIDEDGLRFKHPNPVSDTGFRSEFVPSADIDALGSPETWVREYMEARALAWDQPNSERQLSLFD